MNEQFLPHKEIREKGPKYGANIKIHAYWIRHTQKASGEVFNAAGTGTSISSISENGALRAKERGATLTASLHGSKGFKSSSERTQETFDALIEGYSKNNPYVPIREKVRVKQELSIPRAPKEFLSEYRAQWNANKKRLLEEGIMSGKYTTTEFNKLSPDQQEEIAEAAEEPVVLEWIDNPKSSMAKSFPPRIQAAKFSVLFNRRGERMAKKLNNGSEIDLFHNTHKTVTEPFLASGVLIRNSDGKRISKLEEVGGSLKILDQWESETTTDEYGNPSITITLRGEKYTLDNAVYNQLLIEGQETWKKTLPAK